jgi:hypothetical protein
MEVRLTFEQVNEALPKENLIIDGYDTSRDAHLSNSRQNTINGLKESKGYSFYTQ